MSSANNKTSDDPGDNTITIGIDFGTTYSGVAYTWSKKLARIEIITSWDSDLHSNADLEKAPTAISLDSDKHVLWGYSIPHEFGQIRWFKLLLIDKNDLPNDVQNSPKIAEAVAYLEKHNKSAIDIVSLYLRHIWNHATQRIMETISKDMVCSSKLEIVITLPAIWPAYAVGRMRQAARIAGMLGDRDPGPTILTFVSEPEAAALATLSDMQGRHDIKIAFVVVDCGGGTVDLISYDMVSLSPATVKECVKGQGGLCGAVFVDEAFTDILKRKFGKNKWRKLGDDARHRIQHDEWENGIKTQFDGSYREWKFTMPWECLEHVDLKSGTLIPKIVITSDEIQRAFDPVLDKIFVMVQEQVAAVTRKKGHGPKVSTGYTFCIEEANAPRSMSFLLVALGVQDISFLILRRSLEMRLRYFNLAAPARRFPIVLVGMTRFADNSVFIAGPPSAAEL
ncbi:uncharacterized protein PODANS_6_8790 [Podospora anserina S mat+]|uniref:Podospora anserina S mat+ genomic DNA chromosome 6, supercontig 4 n=1 Tax=Podospora anserina (strain S / ATCC MYA-4624 / DSM 980 / FGSC 10383) TaxID=515849 RepID=B2AN28_PODAN|nr:uncharacterized protein PODANS_6_8790 [Podospora anserina S mat+]CAP65369.1 unnamed protein product [Podospora anserina S mat+]CDP31365.1 Putative protein of unknown function [Podospora anserina S mat+]